MADDTGGGGGFSLGNIADAGKGLISAAGSLFGGSTQAGGYDKEAALYDQAAQLEDWNMTYAKESGDVQKILAERQFNQVEGARAAQVGANGFEDQGSSQDIAKSDWNQFGITKGMIGIQTGIQMANYQAQKLGYQAQASSARAAAQAAQGGGIMGALGSAMGIIGKFLPI